MTLDMSQERRRLMTAFVALTIVSASWGANVPVSKVLLQHFDLIPLAAVRTAIACIVLAMVLAAVEGPRALRVGIGPKRFALLGLLMGSFVLVYQLGLRLSDPISAAIVQVVAPLVAAATVGVISGARLDPGFGVALALSLLGGAVLVAGSMGARSISFGAGEILILFAHVLWTIYSLKSQEWFAGSVSQLHRSYVASLSVLIWSSALSVGLIMGGYAASPFGLGSSWLWTQLVVISIFAGGVAGYLWNVGTARIGVANASLWTNVVPLFAVLWSIAYGFEPTAYQIVGGSIALLGVIFMQWKKLSRA